MGQGANAFSRTLLQAETRFERRVLYPFDIFLIAGAMVAIVHLDWWLIFIAATSLTLHGIVGARLAKNRHKTPKNCA